MRKEASLHLYVTDALMDEVRRVCDGTGLTPSECVRRAMRSLASEGMMTDYERKYRTAHGIRTGWPRRDAPDVTAPGKNDLRVRAPAKLAQTLPDRQRLRERLHDVCAESLERRAWQARDRFETSLVEGRDYVVINEEQ